MALLPSGTTSRITLRDTLYPLFILYVVSYGLMLQQTFASTSPTLLFVKLLLGVFVLGGPSLYILKYKSAFVVPVFPKRIHWLLALASFIFGLFLLYAFLSVKILWPAQFPTFLLYYGYFNPHSALYYPLIITLGVYVLTEEFLFRGVIYQYLRNRYGLLVAALLTAAAFAIAHLNFYLPLIILLVVLSLVASSLLERTGVYLYGYIIHATLDIVALLLDTSGVSAYLYADIYLRAGILAALSVCLAWLLFFSRWSKKLLPA